MALEMEIKEIGNTYELKRDQWKGNTASISNDPTLLEEVKKYTWTYNEGKHPYLRCSKLGTSLHEFVLGYVYGAENINRMQAEGNIIEHLDNNGLNCTYENLHILSEDLNKTKAFSIDKMNKEELTYPSYIMDVYYLHEKKMFQMQICLNNDLYFNKETGRAVEMFICRYTSFEKLFIDWFYLLNSRKEKAFDLIKFNASQIWTKERSYIEVSPEQKNSPVIIKNGIAYLNLDAKHDGKPLVHVSHTSLRQIDE